MVHSESASHAVSKFVYSQGHSAHASLSLSLSLEESDHEDDAQVLFIVNVNAANMMSNMLRGICMVQ
eukprot:CAMPEP_0197030278 /NCGR_PEP_ID=MMETSP1384-20130603/9545_1 /TAXON_ID=29189 /ORGANISM="Ammonia sp." /LENGTH=66 /DNA_ID=CAMNT_0042459593 /DNA_START=203 /DNA_END=403 /DNA_ORIENTATION=-